MENMTHEIWVTLSPIQREKLRNYSSLSPQLTGLEGWRVEVLDKFGETRRFIVGRSTGWKPVHIEVKLRSSTGGMAADKDYVSVRKLYKARGQ